ncbi:MAG: 50S ribosomal protein L30e [Candidatus Diapherotrites archaeon]|uniref:Large ribosomal subunit protein eL30 n=1 Tax=Candidatus Iainarchaeum sp. TaxID=3101447 RepID=A0A7J4IS14_9ARCH|nr:MAG: large subunit ribosomal protein L30e [archaeon GW2011_AR10]MBS3059565.1 50S ribosomal protein L30e [Candidatus Diapherotrites archaeon]HIH08313.1 50S ribosomal protein L30e [Candidatus Diapherotrites archaeon]
MAVDISKEIRRAVDSGKTVFGLKQSSKSVLTGSGKLLIVAGNTPAKIREKAIGEAGVSSIPVYEFNGSGLELGSVCGKPFTVSLMVVEDEGKSKVVEAVTKKAVKAK